MSSALRVIPAAISLAQAASSMIRGLGRIWAWTDRGRLSTRRGSNRPVIHSHSMRSTKNPRMWSMRWALPFALSGWPNRVRLWLCPAHCPIVAVSVSATYSAAMSRVHRSGVPASGYRSAAQRRAIRMTENRPRTVAGSNVDSRRHRSAQSRHGGGTDSSVSAQGPRLRLRSGSAATVCRIRCQSRSLGIHGACSTRRTRPCLGRRPRRPDCPRRTGLRSRRPSSTRNS